MEMLSLKGRLDNGGWPLRKEILICQEFARHAGI